MTTWPYTAAVLSEAFDLHDDDARWLLQDQRGLRLVADYVDAYRRAEDKAAFVHDAQDGLTGQLVDLFIEADRGFTGPRPSVEIVSVLERVFAEVTR